MLHRGVVGRESGGGGGGGRSLLGGGVLGAGAKAGLERGDLGGEGCLHGGHAGVRGDGVRRDLVSGRYCSPCHNASLKSRTEGSKCVSMTWRAMSDRPYRELVLCGGGGGGGGGGGALRRVVPGSQSSPRQMLPIDARNEGLKRGG